MNPNVASNQSSFRITEIPVIFKFEFYAESTFNIASVHRQSNPPATRRLIHQEVTPVTLPHFLIKHTHTYKYIYSHIYIYWIERERKRMNCRLLSTDKSHFAWRLVPPAYSNDGCRRSGRTGSGDGSGGGGSSRGSGRHPVVYLIGPRRFFFSLCFVRLSPHYWNFEKKTTGGEKNVIISDPAVLFVTHIWGVVY